MKDFRHMINNYLLDHKKQKKYLAVVLALSILVTFAVPLSLMQPAESMTIDRSHLAEEMAMATDSAPATGADGSFESPYNQIPTNSDDFSAGITGITLIYNNQVCQPDSSGNYSINAEDAEYADVTMALSFKMPTATISVTDPCIYMELPDGFTVPNEYFGSGSYLSDKKFSDAGYKTKPAYYSINKDGLIVIQLTQDYLEFIKNGDSYEGTLNFNGRITRAETSEGDRTVTLGGHNINVAFDDTTYDVRKEGTVTRNSNGDGAIITWKVTAESYGMGSLNNIILTDEHFPDNPKNNVTIDPTNAGTFEPNGFRFNRNARRVTFTYEQYVSKEELKTIYSGSMKESNTAELKSRGPAGTVYDTVTAEVTFENTSVTKNGTEDYKTGSMNRMIDWTITVENPYGVDLSGYEITDGMLSNAVDGTLMVQDGSGNAISNYSYSKSEPEGTLILPEGLTSSKVIIKYKTPAEIGKNYTNTVKVFYPNSENKASETTESVTYTNPYQLEKSASSFDPEKKKVYWEVTAKSISDHVLLDGLVITDDALTNLSMKDVEVVFVRSGQNSSITAENADTSISLGDYGTLTKNGSDITITGGTAGGLNEIRLRYATDVTDEQINAQATVQNTVSDSSGNEKTADKTLTTTYTLNKQGTFDAAAQAVNWTITVKNTASNTATLDGIVLTDAAFTDLFSKNFKLDYAYYPSYTGISGTVSASSNEVVFENGSKMTLNGNTLTFTNMDGKGVNEVKFTYQTPVSDSDIASGTKQSNEVTANRPVTGNTKAEAQVNNPYSLDKNGVFDAASGEVTWTVTVKNTAGNNASLAGVVLTDEAFANMDFSKLKVTSANYNYQNVTASVSGSTITFGENGSGSAVFSGNQLTFSEDAKVKEIVFQYNTAVSQEDFKNQKTQSNKISDSFENEKTAEVQVKNPYSLTKGGYFDSRTGTVIWEVEVSGVNAQDAIASLDGVEISDNAFKELVDGINITSASWHHNYWYAEPLTTEKQSDTVYHLKKDNVVVAEVTVDTASGKISIACNKDNSTSCKGVHNLKFTYATKVSEDDILSQKPQTNGVYDNKGNSASKSVTPQNPFTLSKSGIYDAANQSVIWTIHTKNQAGGNLGGVELTDAAFANLTIQDIKVVSAGQNGNNNIATSKDEAAGTITIMIDQKSVGTVTLSDGKLLISSDAVVDDIKFEFVTKVTDEEKQNAKAVNIVSSNKQLSSVAEVPIVDPYRLEKNGSYNEEDALLTWEIKAWIDSTLPTATIGGTALNDEGFKRLNNLSSVTLKTARYNNTYLSIIQREGNVITLGSGTTAYATITFDTENGTAAFANATEDGTTGLTEVQFTYQVEPTAEERALQKAVNTVTFSDKTASKEVNVTSRSSFTKHFDTQNKSETVYGDKDADTRVLDWHLEMLEDGGYADKDVLVDTLTGTIGGTHYLTKAQADAIKITACQKKAQNYTTSLTENTDYTITFYDNNNQVISEWGTDTKAVKFEIKFNSSVDTAKLRYLKVNYQTTANTRAVIVAENAENKTTAWFGNQAEFDGESKVDQGFEFNRYPADYVEKVSIKVNKNWPNLDPNSQSEVQVQLYQKLTGSSEWQPYDDPVSLSKDNYWTYTWNKLPKTNKDRTVEYLYKVVEDEVAGFRTSYSTEDGINSGEITVTNSLIPYADKVYVSATGEKADGSRVQLSELAKETIDGTAYYIMQWKITPNPKGGVVTDTLPDDWTLLEDASNSVNKYGPFAGNSPYYQPSIVGSIYDVTYQNNGKTVTFDFMQGNYAYILYYLKIPVSKLEEKITSGSYAVENTVKAENGESDTVTITLTKQTDSNLLSKNAVQSEYPGLMTYQIILNPDGKNLANGDTIDVTDYFDLENFVSQYNPPSVSQMNVNLESISVHYLNGVSVGTDGEMTPDIGTALNSSQYQYTVGYKETETIIADYELVYTKDANNHPYWYVTSCVPGDEVTMILNTKEQNGDGYLYKPDWSGVPVQSKSYDSEKQQLTLKFTVPDGVTSLIINKNVDVVTAVTATAARDITPTAKLSITVPDETPLVITYDYQMTGYEFLPNELGTITASNEAMFNTGNAQGWDAEENMEFEVDTSHGTISGNSPPKIRKSDTNDYTVSLDAKFKLAYYDGTTKNWVFAVDDELDSETGSHKPIWEMDGTKAVSANSLIPEGAHTFELGDMYVAWNSEDDSGKLYKLVEVDVPSNYEGSNVIADFNLLLKSYKAGTYTGDFTPYLEKFTQRYPDATGEGQSAATFEQMLQMYYQKSSDNVNGPYDHFFDLFQSEFYFTYGSKNYVTPDNFTKTVQTVPISGTLSLTNSKLMKVTASKAWDSTADVTNATVTLKLYWSETKSSTGFPSVLKPATAESLGLITQFEGSQTIGANDEAVWQNLPAGINGKPIYYYVKEIAYTIDGVTYELDEATGEYVNGSSEKPGEYKPIYSGNAGSGGDTAVSVTNTKGLTIEKVWKNSDNSAMEKTPLNEVPVNLYGVSGTGSARQETFIGQLTIKGEKGWTLTVDSKAYNLEGYDSFRVEEAVTGTELYGYAISYTYNTTGAAGTITVTNRDNTPTEVEVSVTKTWADSAAHAPITVKLWRTTDNEIDDNGISLTEKNAELLATVELSTDNGWTKTWEEKFPYKSQNNERYYYYPVEVVPEGYAANYSRDEKSASQSVTINNYVPGKLNLEKIWKSGSETISGSSSLLPDSVELEIYRTIHQNTVASDKVPNNVSVVTVGDSITLGTFNEYVAESKTYPMVLLNTYLANHEEAVVNRVADNQKKIDDIKSAIQYSDSSYYPADAIFILAGTNDIINSNVAISSENENDVTLETKLKELIAMAYEKNSANPDGRVFVGTIPRFTALSWDNERGIPKSYTADETIQAQWDVLVNSYNDVVKSVVSELQNEGKKIYLVDMYTAVGDELYDGCHPNETGYNNIAKACFEALNNSYGGVNASEEIGEHEPIDGLPDDLSNYELVTAVPVNITSPDWKLSLDVPDKDNDGNEYIYYVKEKTTGYEVAYESNGQIIGNNSETIKITNTINVPKTNIYVEKTWIDSGSTNRPALTLTLKRSADNGSTWESVTNASISWNTESTPWKGTYSDLEMCDLEGKYFIYKVEETVPSGYAVTYANPDGIQLNANSSDADRTLKLTNTAVFNLNVKKVWSDGEDSHVGDTVTIEIHRETTDRTTGSDLMLALSTNILKVQTGSDSIVTANSSSITAESDNTDVATVQVSGNTITIHGKSNGTATITVKSGSETETIDVTVSDAPVLTLSGEKTKMTAGETQQLTAAMSDSSQLPGTVTYQSSNEAVAIVDANGNVSALNQGEVTITAKCGDELTATYTLSVELSETFGLSLADADGKIYVGDTTKVTPDPSYGTFEYEYDSEIVTVKSDGTVEGVGPGEATIVAKRNDGKTAQVKITVEEVPLTVSPTDVTLVIGQTQQLEVNPSTAKFKPSPDGIVTVSDSGLITAQAAGTATITVTSGSQTKEVKVTVIASSEMKVVESGETWVYTVPQEARNNVTNIAIEFGAPSGYIDVDYYLYDSNSTSLSYSWLTNSNTSSVVIWEWSNDYAYDGTELHGAADVQTDNVIDWKWNKSDQTKPTLKELKFAAKTNSTELTIKTITFTLENGTVLKYYSESGPASGGTESTAATTSSSETTAQALTIRPTTNTATSSAHLAKAAADEEYDVEFVNDVATITIKASDNWEKLIQNLPVSDASGNAYYYWIEEKAVSGYTPSYKFEDGDAITADQDYCINAAAPGNAATATVKNTRNDTGGVTMPSTGGTGTRWYYIAGMMMMLVGVAGTIGLKRRQSSQR